MLIELYWNIIWYIILVGWYNYPNDIATLSHDDICFLHEEMHLHDDDITIVDEAHDYLLMHYKLGLHDH